MVYRELTKEDLPSLLLLYRQLDEKNSSLSLEKSRALWEKEIESNLCIKYFGAVDQGKVVSSCYAVLIPNLTNGNRGICYVENVVTDSAYRRQGLASKVLQMAIDYAKEKHCYKVILQSGKSRSAAHSFYEQMGFSGDSKKAFDMRLQ